MTTKLIQKHPLKGRREFELVDDAVNVIIDMPFLNKEFTVVLSIVDPEPVVLKGSTLAFVSAVNREPLLELFIDRPDPQSFSDFVARVRQRAIEEDYGKPKSSLSGRKVDGGQLQMSLDMLRAYLAEDDIKPFLEALEALKAEPDSDARFDDMFQAFNELGPRQGAVLTYAPYVVSLLADDNSD